MRHTDWKRGLLLAALPLAAAAWGCADDDDDDGTGGDGDTDTETDTGTGDECVAPFEWGDSFEKNEVIANWSFTGYIDADGDGIVEQEEVGFDMDTIHCLGLQSIVLAISDTT
jgi:hypothetical protein